MNKTKHSKRIISVITEMPFFKESMYIDEKLRQELNTMIQTNNEELVNNILNYKVDMYINYIENYDSLDTNNS